METLDDMLFENRNKEYGAYFLRKNYPGYLKLAMVIGVGVFVLIFGGAWTYTRYNTKMPELIEKVHGPFIIACGLRAMEMSPRPAGNSALHFGRQPPVPEDDLIAAEEPIVGLSAAPDALGVSDETKEGIEVITSCPILTGIAEVVIPERPAEVEDEGLYLNVEQKPEFPGGETELYRFINSVIRYPAEAQRANVSGKVYVKFVVEKDGSIANVEVLKGIGFGCNEETVRVIKAMPKWTPGRQNGKNVRVYYNMPVFYQLIQ